MPIYEYVCRNCGEELEQLQRMSDDALTDCPACGESTLKRKISAAGFRLSGGGWYETDFKSDGKRNLAGADDKSSSSKADAKTASAENGSTQNASKDSAKAAPAKATDSGDSKPSAKKKSSDSSSSAS